MFPTNPFLKKSLFTAAAPAAACLTLALAASAQTTPSPGGQMVPLRPPAAPLIVRSPYVSAWQNVDALDGQAPTFWAGRPKASPASPAWTATPSSSWATRALGAHPPPRR